MSFPKKIVIITSHLEGRAIAYEWMIKHLTEKGYLMSFYHIASNESNFEKFIKVTGVKYKRIEYKGKGKIELIKIIFKVARLLFKDRPHCVHTHYFDANLIGLTAAKLVFVPKRIYTRHTTTQRYRYLKGTYNFEKYFNRLSTHIVSISDVVTNVLSKIEHVPVTKIVKIHHGFDMSIFANIGEERLRVVREKYNYVNRYPIFGVISRYDEWKGVEYTIQAFKEYVKDEPDALLILANANGIRKEYMHQMLSELPEDSYREVVYEDDVFALINTFNAFIHVPIDEEIEAFGQVYIEVMAASVPIICTLSGIASEFIKNEYNALVVNYKDSDSVHKAMNRIISNQALRELLTANAHINLKKQFGIEHMINLLDKLYSK